MEIINVITEFTSCDPFELIENVINNNNRISGLNHLRNLRILSSQNDFQFFLQQKGYYSIENHYA